MQRVGKKRFEKEKEREKGKRDEREVQQEEEGGIHSMYLFIHTLSKWQPWQHDEQPS